MVAAGAAVDEVGAAVGAADDVAGAAVVVAGTTLDIKSGARVSFGDQGNLQRTKTGTHELVGSLKKCEIDKSVNRIGKDADQHRLSRLKVLTRTRWKHREKLRQRKKENVLMSVKRRRRGKNLWTYLRWERR